VGNDPPRVPPSPGSPAAEGVSTTLTTDQLVEALVAELTQAERASAVAYYAQQPLPQGAPLDAPGSDVVAPFDSFLGFVDREPTANWGHSCRYLLINRENKEVVSIEAQLPPFKPADQHQWCVAYKAPSVPDAAVAVSI